MLLSVSAAAALALRTRCKTSRTCGGREDDLVESKLQLPSLLDKARCNFRSTFTPLWSGCAKHPADQLCKKRSHMMDNDADTTISELHLKMELP
jgi:hypothetical protein